MSFASSQDVISSYIESISNNTKLSMANISFHVVDADGQALMSYKADEMLSPKSIIKMVTTAAAMDLLGISYEHTTVIYTQGSVHKGNLEGSLVVKGGGDPTLGSKRFDRDRESILAAIVDAVKKLGIKSISKDLVVDISSFETALANRYWELEDVGNYYGAGSAALNFSENCYAISFDTSFGIEQQTKIARMDPEIEGVTVKNEVKVADPHTLDEAYVFGGEYSPLQIIRGTLPQSEKLQTIKALIPDPPLFFLQELKKALNKAGIQVLGTLRVEESAISKATLQEILCLKSPSCLDIVSVIHQTSLNILSEGLLKQIGYVKSGFGSTKTGIAAVRSFLERLQVPKDSFLIEDGSGLSSRNLVTASSFCYFLRSLKQLPSFDKWKASLLPSDTIFRLPKGFKGDLSMKTGSSKHIKSIAGYYKNEEGKNRVFCFIASYPTLETQDLKKAMDDFLLTMMVI